MLLKLFLEGLDVLLIVLMPIINGMLVLLQSLLILADTLEQY